MARQKASVYKGWIAAAQKEVIGAVYCRIYVDGEFASVRELATYLDLNQTGVGRSMDRAVEAGVCEDPRLHKSSAKSSVKLGNTNASRGGGGGGGYQRPRNTDDVRAAGFDIGPDLTDEERQVGFEVAQAADAEEWVAPWRTIYYDAIDIREWVEKLAPGPKPKEMIAEIRQEIKEVREILKMLETALARATK